MSLSWEGGDPVAKARDLRGVVRVETTPELYRPADVEHLVGDASKARNSFGWRSETPFRELVEMMVHADLRREGPA